MTGRQDHGLARRAGGQNLVAMALEDLLQEAPNGLFVVHEEDRLLARDRFELPFRRSVGGWTRVGSWQVNPERRPPFGHALDGDRPAALGDDPIDGGESEPGTLPGLLGGEERLEKTRLGFLVH